MITWEKQSKTQTKEESHAYHGIIKLCFNIKRFKDLVELKSVEKGMNLGVEFIYNLKVVAFSVIQNYSHLKFKEFPKVHFIASYGCIAHSTNKSVRKSKTKLLQQTFCCSIHMASRLAHYLAIGRTPEWICGHLLLLFFLWGGEGGKAQWWEDFPLRQCGQALVQPCAHIWWASESGYLSTFLWQDFTSPHAEASTYINFNVIWKTWTYAVHKFVGVLSVHSFERGQGIWIFFKN